MMHGQVLPIAFGSTPHTPALLPGARATLFLRLRNLRGRLLEKTGGGQVQ